MGSVSFTSRSGGVLWIGGNGVGLVDDDWTPILPGHDMAQSGAENIDVDFAAPVLAAGFDFVEPEFGGENAGGFAESIFAISLFDGLTPVGQSFEFEPPNDVALFIGLSSDAPFDRLEFRELVGGIDNEFWGQWYSAPAPSPVPLPAALPLFLSALAGLGLMGWRRRQAGA